MSFQIAVEDSETWLGFGDAREELLCIEDGGRVQRGQTDLQIE